MSKRPLILAVIVITLLAAGTIWYRTQRSQPANDSASAPSHQDFVGAQTCAKCHATEYAAWKSSHHAKAMEVASAASVLGNFDNATFTYGTVTSTFFTRDGKFLVRTDAADGTLKEFEVKYTFGFDPLQQYLIELPGGRLQALSIAWDSRPKDKGGQRWFHLYPGDGVDHNDELHWTRHQQNWNFMCADCHSTNLRKGYDATNDRFETKWFELNVACEACHGPGSRHVEWARQGAREPGSRGLAVQLTERKNVRWDIEPATHAPRRSVPRTTSTEIETCAPCHARREQISESYTAGAPLEDFYVPSFLMPRLYYDDGQQRDEVYIYASFLQSKMAHKGVTCSDCHDPHSQRLRGTGNGLCAQCHAPAKFDNPTHHFHPVTSTGAACVACHMPETTYMVVDPRRDHSIRVPRPDRTISMGVPNACSDCHRDRTAQWAADEIRKRSQKQPAGFQTFAEAFHGAESGDPGSRQALAGIAADTSLPAMVRASALARLATSPTRDSVDAAARHVADPNPMVRRAAAAVFEALAPESRAAVTPLLRDPRRSVRLQAAWVLAPAAGTLTGTPDEQAFKNAAGEFIAARRFAADRPEDRTTLGTFFLHLGRQQEAAAEFRAALRLWPRYTPARVNLSDMQREEGNEEEAERTLRQGLTLAPADPMLHHALGLSLARSGRQREAVAELKRAADLSQDARLIYTYAVALHSSGNVDEAVAVLEKARLRHPRDRDLLFALAAFHRDAGRIPKALDYAKQLQHFHPDDPEARALVASLGGSARQPEM